MPLVRYSLIFRSLVQISTLFCKSKDIPITTSCSLSWMTSHAAAIPYPMLAKYLIFWGWSKVIYKTFNDFKLCWGINNSRCGTQPPPLPQPSSSSVILGKFILTYFHQQILFIESTKLVTSSSITTAGKMEFWPLTLSLDPMSDQDRISP